MSLDTVAGKYSLVYVDTGDGQDVYKTFNPIAGTNGQIDIYLTPCKGLSLSRNISGLESILTTSLGISSADIALLNIQYKFYGHPDVLNTSIVPETVLPNSLRVDFETSTFFGAASETVPAPVGSIHSLSQVPYFLRLRFKDLFDASSGINYTKIINIIRIFQFLRTNNATSLDVGIQRCLHLIHLAIDSIGYSDYRTTLTSSFINPSDINTSTNELKLRVYAIKVRSDASTSDIINFLSNTEDSRSSFVKYTGDDSLSEPVESDGTPATPSIGIVRAQPVLDQFHLNKLQVSTTVSNPYYNVGITGLNMPFATVNGPGYSFIPILTGSGGGPGSSSSSVVILPAAGGSVLPGGGGAVFEMPEGAFAVPILAENLDVSTTDGFNQAKAYINALLIDTVGETLDEVQTNYKMKIAKDDGTVPPNNSGLLYITGRHAGNINNSAKQLMILQAMHNTSFDPYQLLGLIFSSQLAINGAIGQTSSTSPLVAPAFNF